MATVWAPFDAPRIGSWQDRAYSSGWSHTILFSSLPGLRNEMHRRNLDHRVTRLGIVAHGDHPGRVQLNERLDVNSIGSFSEQIRLFGDYLTSDAQFIFYSCIAAAGRKGGEFLCRISNYLPGRTIVGFTVYGLTLAGEALSHMSPQTPGHISPATRLGQRIEGHGFMDPYDVFAKWARNGRIIKDAPVERDAQRHCANPQCPGHADSRHNCQGWPPLR